MIKNFAYNNSYGNYAGSYLNECLPNITGSIYGDEFPNNNHSEATGAFIKHTSTHSDTSVGNAAPSMYIKFDASRMGYYKTNCNAVRPRSYGVYMWVRTS